MDGDDAEDSSMHEYGIFLIFFLKLLGFRKLED